MTLKLDSRSLAWSVVSLFLLYFGRSCLWMWDSYGSITCYSGGAWLGTDYGNIYRGSRLVRMTEIG